MLRKAYKRIDPLLGNGEPIKTKNDATRLEDKVKKMKEKLIRELEKEEDQIKRKRKELMTGLANTMKKSSTRKNTKAKTYHDEPSINMTEN